jgi:hypothetical protein
MSLLDDRAAAAATAVAKACAAEPRIDRACVRAAATQLGWTLALLERGDPASSRMAAKLIDDARAEPRRPGAGRVGGGGAGDRRAALRQLRADADELGDAELIGEIDAALRGG